MSNAFTFTATPRPREHRTGRIRLRTPALVIATTIRASSLACIDGSVVNVGLPAISRSFSS
jgi:hypothetical protein